MSFQLTFGGGETLLVRDKGSTNAVQGFVSEETVVSKNITALPTTVIFQLYELLQISQTSEPPTPTSPNTIKYSTNINQTFALKKGNFYIGTGDVGKGPSDITGYYNGVGPSIGGYTVYLYRAGAPGELSYHSALSDADLITFASSVANQSFTTIQESLVYFAQQSNQVCTNFTYENITTDGLMFNLDTLFTPSYPRTGTACYDISLSNNDSTLFNGPSFSSNGIIFDGNDDIIVSNNTIDLKNKSFTLNSFYAYNATTDDSYIIGGGTPSTNNGLSFGLRQITGTSATLTIDFFNNAINQTITISNNGTYQNFTATYNYDTNTSKLYSNGQLVLSSSMSSAFQNDSFNIEVGSVTLNGKRSWYSKGTLGNVQIYDRVLSDSEVLRNYNAYKTRFGL